MQPGKLWECPQWYDMFQPKTTLPALAGGRVTKYVAYPRPSVVRGGSGDGAG